MPTTYKVLGQIVTEQATRSVTSKQLTDGVVTLTTSVPHNVVVGNPITVSEAAITSTVSNKELLDNVATITTAANHRIVAGQEVDISGVDADFNGTYTILSTTSDTIVYSRFIPEYNRIVTNRALTSNVVTITTSVAHGFEAGDTVTVNIGNAVFDGTYVISTTPTATTFTYPKTNPNVAAAAVSGTVIKQIPSVSSSGTITYLDQAFNGTFAVSSDPTTTTLTYPAPGPNLTSGSATITATHVPWKIAYTCPEDTAAIFSTIMLCNQSEVFAKYQLAISDDTTPLKENLFVYNDGIVPNESIAHTTGITVDDTKKYLLFASDQVDVSCSVFGSEID